MAMPEGSARQHAVGGLAATLFQKDAAGAKAFVASLPAADWQDPSVFREFFRRWLKTEPEQATDVLLKRIPADAHPSPEQQAEYDQMFLSWADSKPRAASEFLLKLAPEVRAKSLSRAVASFCFDDPAGAAAWAGSLPAGSDRDKILGQVAENWAKQGVAQVTQWLDTLPADSGKSAAVESFARTIISTSADDALAWLRAVPDESDRLARLGRVWASWSDREAARQWLENSPELTATEREALRKLPAAK